MIYFNLSRELDEIISDATSNGMVLVSGFVYDGELSLYFNNGDKPVEDRTIALNDSYSGMLVFCCLSASIMKNYSYDVAIKIQSEKDNKSDYNFILDEEVMVNKIISKDYAFAIVDTY